MELPRLPFVQRVLVVEDEPVVSQLLSRILQREAYEVVVVDRAQAGLEAVRQRVFDLLISDLHLPDYSSIQFVSQARIVQPDASAIVITGYPSVEAAVAALRAGADDFVLKPFEPADVLRVVRRSLERKRLQDQVRIMHLQLVRRNQELNKANQILANDIAMTAHDVRSPLTAILASARMLLDKNPSPDRSRMLVETIHDAAARCDTLVTNLLDLSRIDAGQMRMDAQPLRLPPLIEKVVDFYRTRADKHTFEVEAPDIEARGDPLRTSQVLFNLVGNAVKYSPDGGQVSVRVRKDGMFVAIEVQDQGLGIAPEEVPRVFERFYRSKDPRSTKIGGSGVGLFIVKTFVELMGGRVWVQSQPGRGTTFGFSLPQ